MKITDVSLTLFAWDDIPPTQYGQHSRFAGSSALGLLRIATDDGVEGPRLPGLGLEFGGDRRAGPDHASQAHADGPQSDAPRGAGRRSLEAPASGRRAHHRRRRRGPLGSFGQGGRPADPSPARHLSRIGAGLCQLSRPGIGQRVRRAGRRVQGRRLGGLQDPSADALARGHQGLRGGAQRRRRLHHHARFDLGLRLSGRTARRPRRRGDGLTTGTKTRSPTRTSTIT